MFLLFSCHVWYPMARKFVVVYGIYGVWFHVFVRRPVVPHADWLLPKIPLSHGRVSLHDGGNWCHLDVGEAQSVSPSVQSLAPTVQQWFCSNPGLHIDQSNHIYVVYWDCIANIPPLQMPKGWSYTLLDGRLLHKMLGGRLERLCSHSIHLHHYVCHWSSGNARVHPVEV